MIKPDNAAVGATTLIEELAPGVVVVGTAHVSPSSVAEVEAAIRDRRPAKVLVELDPRRLEALRDPEAWRKTDIVQVVKQGKQHLFLLQLYLASVQAKMGRETGVPPGTELLRAVQVAGEVGAEVVLIDRDISITLKRGFAALTLPRRLRLFWNLWLDLLTPAAADKQAQPTAEAIEAMLKTDAITQMTQEFARFAPDIKHALIDERDTYMASHIAEQARLSREAQSRNAGPGTPSPSSGWQSAGVPSAGEGGVVAVVGAGHLPGIRHQFATARPQDRLDLDGAPVPRVTFGKVMAWLVPFALVAVFVYLGYRGYQEGNFQDLLASLGWFALITSTCAALGAAAALGHPWSILAAFVAAPIATLHPLIASGWFAGLAEAKVRTPTVADFEAVKRIETLGQFWRNGVVRILLVTAITNLGAMVGFWIATGRVLQILGGGT